MKKQPSVDDLHDQLRAARGYGRPVFCLGDTNINILRPDGPGVRQYKAALHELDLVQLVTEPTHLEPAGTLIDHIITDVPDLTATVVPPPDVIADHLTVIVRAPVGLRGCRPAPFTARLCSGARPVEPFTSPRCTCEAGGAPVRSMVPLAGLWLVPLSGYDPARAAQLVHGFRYGFPLGSAEVPSGDSGGNLPSCSLAPEVVDAYVFKELRPSAAATPTSWDWPACGTLSPFTS
ncbi:hypothetical protein FJT64_027337 [Amphibalanus amphitrite]|uniref:Uncharacterized protein n=1 Tax=Amphibalanus amphitrite TaxID=1232801 RepID=A0A6A4WDL7_AMPAM|nr:hypothetical protein FJT64_027337 [Amphibalanus amphitrite]